MKRFVVLLTLGLLLLGCLTACALAGESVAVFGPEPPAALTLLEGKEIVEIREKMFLAQINDIFLNADDYLGKAVKYQGIYSGEPYGDAGQIYQCVYRNSPGCCGADGMAGFEIIWDQSAPQNNDWVEVVGLLERYEESGAQYLRVQVASLTVLPERGAEFVTQ